MTLVREMGNGRVLNLVFPFLIIFVIIPIASGWGSEGHTLICRIAQGLLSKVATESVRKLLPTSANGDLGQLCPWPDRIRFRYPWSSELHYINTPDHLCTYRYNRDCKNKNGEKGRCVEGAIKNYTTQLLSYRNKRPLYNLTEALIFLSHFIGDIHQPLHVGFISDKGGNMIKVNWFGKKHNLHRVWDTEIIRRAKGREVKDSNMEAYTKKIQQKINSQWSKKVNKWRGCSFFQKTCTNVYAEESVKAACESAYKGVHNGSLIKEDYFQTRLPVVELRLAEAGVRLAAILNRIFK